MELNPETREIDRLFRDVHKHLVQYTKGKLRDHDLTMPRFLVLWHISKFQPVNMSFLHNKLYMANSTLTVIVDKLVEENLVKRYRNPDDRRIVLLELTEDGDQLLCKMLNVRQSFLEEALHDLKTKQQQELIELLTPVKDNLEKLLDRGDDIDE